MLEWTIRWGVPLALIAAYVLLGDSRVHGPGDFAQYALDSLRDILTGLVPKFF